MDKSWKSDLERWLAPFLSAFRHKARARMCPVYVAGLIGAGDRKSVQPMAAREGDVGYDQLHHFIASGVWDAAPLEKALLVEADRMVGGADAWLIVDDTAIPKKGTQSVGVARQYCGRGGQDRELPGAGVADVGASRGAGADRPAPVPAAGCGWAILSGGCAAAGVPQAACVAQSKPEIALAEIDRVMAAGVRFGCVLADAGYGASAAFRHALSERGLRWAVGIPCTPEGL